MSKIGNFPPSTRDQQKQPPYEVPGYVRKSERKSGLNRLLGNSPDPTLRSPSAPHKIPACLPAAVRGT